VCAAHRWLAQEIRVLVRPRVTPKLTYESGFMDDRNAAGLLPSGLSNLYHATPDAVEKFFYESSTPWCTRMASLLWQAV
jgi:hypothetical protein